MNIKASENHQNTNLTQHHVLHQDIEKGTSNKENNNVNTPKVSQIETNGTVAKTCAHEDEKKYDIKNNNEIVVKNKNKNKRHIASASTALLFGSILGLIQASILVFAAKPLLSLMGVKHVSVNSMDHY